MSDSPKFSGPNSKQWWTDKRVVCVGLLLLAGLYVLAEPTLEKILKIDLPSLVDRDKPANGNGDDDAGEPNSGKPFKIDLTMLDKSPKKGGDAKQTNSSSNASSGFKLTEVGRNTYKSPAGLVYTPGSKEGHRIAHIMLHAKNDKSRAYSHGVFNESSQEGVLKLLDDAYTMIKSNAKGVRKEKQGDRPGDAYVIDMPTVIGYVGGKDGAKQNNPKTKRLKLILIDDRVITAYPTWPPRGRR